MYTWKKFLYFHTAPPSQPRIVPMLSKKFFYRNQWLTRYLPRGKFAFYRSFYRCWIRDIDTNVVFGPYHLLCYTKSVISYRFYVKSYESTQPRVISRIFEKISPNSDNCDGIATKTVAIWQFLTKYRYSPIKRRLETVLFLMIIILATKAL